jgi:streptomycin 6-kinase
VIVVPASLDHLRCQRGGPEWLAALPDLVAAAVKRWSLRLGQPFADVHESMTFPALTSAGESVVLKVQWPNRDNALESAALRAWDGDGAIRLLDEDVGRHVLLLERCLPGTSLASVDPEAALDACVDLLPRLWVTPRPGFRTLADESATLSVELVAAWERTGRAFERRLVDIALDAFATLPTTQGPAVLLDQDLHGDNVLRSERGWLAIDPKPLAGEREFGIAPIVRSRELGHSRRHMLRRFARLTSDLGLDRERARLWTIAHTVAWGFDGDGIIETHLETARWLDRPR